MLAIHHRLLDRVKNLKAVTAGALAFGVGLTAAAAYVGATMVYDNFSYDFDNKTASSKVAGASTEAEIKAKNEKQEASAKAANATTPGTTTPISGQTGTTGSASGSTTTSGGGTGTTPIVGGMGAGYTAPTVTITPTPTPTTEPIQIVSPNPGECLCGTVTPITDPVLNTVDATVDGLGL